MGGWGTIGDPVNIYISVDLLTLSDQMINKHVLYHCMHVIYEQKLSVLETKQR